MAAGAVHLSESEEVVDDDVESNKVRSAVLNAVVNVEAGNLSTVKQKSRENYSK